MLGGNLLAPLEVTGARMVGKAIDNVINAPNTAEDSKPDDDLNARLLSVVRSNKNNLRP